MANFQIFLNRFHFAIQLFYFIVLDNKFELSDLPRHSYLNELDIDCGADNGMFPKSVPKTFDWLRTHAQVYGKIIVREANFILRYRIWEYFEKNPNWSVDEFLITTEELYFGFSYFAPKDLFLRKPCTFYSAYPNKITINIYHALRCK